MRYGLPQGTPADKLPMSLFAGPDATADANYE